MKKRSASITIKTDGELKEELLKQSIALGITLSEFGESCLKKSLMKDEVENEHEKEIEKLKNNINQLVEAMKEQDQEVELAKKILKNNGVLIETNKKLNTALKGFVTKIQELEKMNETLKSNQEKEKQIVQQKEKGIKVGFQNYF